jgi:hypothetical protein
MCRGVGVCVCRNVGTSGHLCVVVLTRLVSFFSFSSCWGDQLLGALAEVHDECRETALGDHIALEEWVERAVPECLGKASPQRLPCPVVESANANATHPPSIASRSAYLGLSLMRR